MREASCFLAAVRRSLRTGIGGCAARILATALVLILSVPIPRALAASPMHVAVVQYQLPNGLRVILHEDHRLPQVATDIWFRVGSTDEQPRRTGLAHLFEHMMFMGTKGVPNGQFDQIIEAVGGQKNATTSTDRTNYFEVGPSSLLETFLWLEADRLATLPDDMTLEKLDLQRDVVKNERRERYENRPYSMLELVLPERVFAPDNPYHHPVIGSHEDLTAASVDDVKAFFARFYIPANAALVIVGDFKVAAARAMVERYFGWMPRSAEPPHATPGPALLTANQRAELEDDVTLERAVLAWPSAARYDPEEADWEILAAVLGNGRASRLYRALVVDREVAQSVQVRQRSLRSAGLFVITVTGQPGHGADELEQAVDAELGRISSEPPTSEEISRARAQLQTDALSAVEPLVGMADRLAEIDMQFGDARRIDTLLLGRYDGRTPTDVRAVASRLVGNHVTIRVVPRRGPP